MKKIFMLLCCLCVLGATAQTTVMLPADSYNTIFQLPNNSSGAGSHFFVGRSNGNQPPGTDLKRALLHFDLSGIPPGSVVTDVNLSLRVNRSSVAGVEVINLHTVLQPWGQGTSNSLGSGIGAPSTLNDANWNCTFSDGAGGCITPWTTPGGDFDPMVLSSAAVGGPGVYMWPSSAALIAAVQAWVDTPANNFGFIIIGNEIDLGTAKRFDSPSAGKGGSAPVLEITYNALSVVKNTFSDAITAYPNPTYDNAMVEFGKTYNIIRGKVTNMAGQTVSTFTEKSVNELTIEITGAPGIYFVELASDSGEKATLKLIKR